MFRPEMDAVTKPAKLSRGRAPKPLLPLGLKRRKKLPPARKDKEAMSNKGESSSCDKASDEQVLSLSLSTIAYKVTY